MHSRRKACEVRKSSRSGESQSSQNWQLGQTGQLFISTGVFSHCFEGGASYLREVWNVSSVNAHLLLGLKKKRRRKLQICLRSSNELQQERQRAPPPGSGCYLCYFEELRYPSHASEELLVDVQAFFTLGLLHVKVFLCCCFFFGGGGRKQQLDQQPRQLCSGRSHFGSEISLVRRSRP